MKVIFYDPVEFELSPIVLPLISSLRALILPLLSPSCYTFSFSVFVIFYPRKNHVEEPQLMMAAPPTSQLPGMAIFITFILPRE